MNLTELEKDYISIKGVIEEGFDNEQNNPSGTLPFLRKNYNDLIFIWYIYQMIEYTLFQLLYIPYVVPDKSKHEFSMESLSKVLNSKTIGSLKKRYLLKYPNDDVALFPLLEIVNEQRNFFMHSFTIFLSKMKNKQSQNKFGKKVLSDYKKNAIRLTKKIMKLMSQKIKES